MPAFPFVSASWENSSPVRTMLSPGGGHRMWKPRSPLAYGGGSCLTSLQVVPCSPLLTSPSPTQVWFTGSKWAVLLPY